MTSAQLLLWLPMIAIAFANALIREKIFINHFPETRAHQLSTITLIIFCTIYTWLVYSRLQIQSSKQALLVGFIWVLLTIAFEIAIGRINHKSWSFTVRDYNLIAGRLWPVFLFVLLMLPWLVHWLKRK
jgi:predicted neutral ceramidase superfamily lipid hydrolase